MSLDPYTSITLLLCWPSQTPETRMFNLEYDGSKSKVNVRAKPKHKGGES